MATNFPILAKKKRFKINFKNTSSYSKNIFFLKIPRLKIAKKLRKATKDFFNRKGIKNTEVQENMFEDHFFAILGLQNVKIR